MSMGLKTFSNAFAARDMMMYARCMMVRAGLAGRARLLRCSLLLIVHVSPICRLMFCPTDAPSHTLVAHDSRSASCRRPRCSTLVCVRAASVGAACVRALRLSSPLLPPCRRSSRSPPLHLALRGSFRQLLWQLWLVEGVGRQGFGGGNACEAYYPLSRCALPPEPQ